MTPHLDWADGVRGSDFRLRRALRLQLALLAYVNVARALALLPERGLFKWDVNVNKCADLRHMNHENMGLGVG